MKFLLKTQIIALLFALLWAIYLSIIAFFDQPGKALQYINWFVYGFALIFGIIYLVISMFSFERKLFLIPLVLIPDIFLYQPMFLRFLFSIFSEGFAGVVRFISLSTGSINLIVTLFGLLLGIRLSRQHR